jgi:hypothetical protein
MALWMLVSHGSSVSAHPFVVIGGGGWGHGIRTRPAARWLVVDSGDGCGTPTCHDPPVLV